MAALSLKESQPLFVEYQKASAKEVINMTFATSKCKRIKRITEKKMMSDQSATHTATLILLRWHSAACLLPSAGKHFLCATVASHAISSDHQQEQ